jgi:hypothetical protein
MLKHLIHLAVAASFGLMAPTCLAAKPKDVLWVGNSRTYVHNLPEIYRAIVKASTGVEPRAEMLVEGGGRLSGRAESGALLRELKAAHYDVVMLQERGGLLMCQHYSGLFAAKDCEQSAKAHSVLVSQAHAAGARAMLFGTVVLGQDGASLLSGEQALQREVTMDGYVPLSEFMGRAMQAAPNLRWLEKDGYHPGFDMSVAMALVSYRVVEGSWPKPAKVDFALHDFNAGVGFGDQVLGSLNNPGFPARRTTLSLDYMAQMIALARLSMRE